MTAIKRYLEETTQMTRRCIKMWPEDLGALSGIRYCCLEEFVLEHGQQFRVGRPTRSIRRGKTKECYRNTWNLIPDHDDLTYVEGIGFNHEFGLGFVHAWAVDTEGNVIDPTWGYHPKTEYFGIPFDWQFVNQIIGDTEVFGLLEPFRISILAGTWKYVRAASVRRNVFDRSHRLEAAL